MTSQNLDPSNRQDFVWNRTLTITDYVLTHWMLETAADPWTAAVGIAKEQSATLMDMSSYGISVDLGASTARVVDIEELGEAEDRLLPEFRLQTDVYEVEPSTSRNRVRVQIAFPIANFGSSLTNLWSAMIAETFRLGFVSGLKLIDFELPDTYLAQFPGPKHGTEGIRELLQIRDRPLLCRSTRPAVGLSSKDMATINECVLRHGFDFVKDDELTCDTPLSAFADRQRQMAAMARRVEAETGEKKMCVANCIDNPRKAFALASQAQAAGVHALLAAPCLQGLGMLGDLRDETGLVVISHNSGEDTLVRHPRFGVSRPAWIKIQRLAGADMIMLPTEFMTNAMAADSKRACIYAAAGPLGDCRPALPILAGGKRPEDLSTITAAIGSPDFVVIAATAVDGHPDGPAAGARAFREAWQVDHAHRVSC